MTLLFREISLTVGVFQALLQMLINPPCIPVMWLHSYPYFRDRETRETLAQISRAQFPFGQLNKGRVLDTGLSTLVAAGG